MHQKKLIRLSFMADEWLVDEEEKERKDQAIKKAATLVFDMVFEKYLQ